jgi:diguanylate cyclase (GGDEF)-like protein
VHSVALFDVDSFNKYNDTYGHAAGDEVLRLISTTMRSGTRKSDRLYKYGGEEILLVLPLTSEDGAEKLCQGVLHTHCTSAALSTRGAPTTWLR